MKTRLRDPGRLPGDLRFAVDAAVLGVWCVEAVTLCESRLSPSGLSYDAITRGALAACHA